MPEGPSILLMKEDLQKFAGQRILGAAGNAKIEMNALKGKKLVEIRTFGKQTFLVSDEISIRVHLLLFGSYSINEPTKPEGRLRLALFFKTGAVFFYTCSVKIIENEALMTIDWEADVLSDTWDPAKAEKKLQSVPDRMVCDALMDQQIFSGVGNIIKNEVLFRIGVQPESLPGKLTPQKLKELVSEARNYSFQFLEWKRAFVLKKHWLVHTKSICPKCGQPLVKKHTGLGKRRSFYCATDQVLYR
ncbi:endonuclease [Niabella ginsenosidivorans]|uniref:Endonuclease n=1 Tax=Niabella ginsenosidivorans TaxID=1176587 RepID=A0A1A9I5X5_9BACT|nr:DNA-formamidopyrimidine glycosylase family protein [Niabella ginsenosidivorans]ANH82091.1 endonuclease [Niabella ginsenosidivorans]